MEQPEGEAPADAKPKRAPLSRKQLAVLVFGWLFICGGCWALTRSGGPSTTTPATPCERAFAAAAAVSDYEDTVSDLDPAIKACGSLSEWKTAAANNPGAISAGVDPITFLVNRCINEPSLAGQMLCIDAIGSQ